MIVLTDASAYRKTEKFQDVDGFRRWLAGDFRHFVTYACQRQGLKVGRIQLYVADCLQAGHSTVLIQCFRGASKSFLIDCYIVWRWLRYIDTKVLLLSAKEHNAAKHVRNVQKIILSMGSVLDFMTFSKRTETGLQLSAASAENDLSLNTAGIFSAIESSRADLVIVDDAEVKANSATQPLRDKLTNRFSEVQAILHPAHRHARASKKAESPKEGTSAIYIGTPKSEFSVYNVPADAETHPLKDSFTINIPALIDGRSAFPERFTTEQLRLKRLRMSSPEWYLEMLLDPSLLDKQLAVLKLDTIKTNSKVEIVDAVMAVDPAGDSGTGKDEAALAIGGIAKGEAKVHIAAIQGFKGKTGIEFVKDAIALAKQHKVRVIVVESNFNAYVSLFQREVGMSGMSVFGVKSRNRKLDRLIETLEAPINAGQVSFDPAILKDKDTLFQFKTFAFAAEPEPNDRIDALSILLGYYQDKGIFRYNSGFKVESSSIQHGSDW